MAHQPASSLSSKLQTLFSSPSPVKLPSEPLPFAVEKWTVQHVVTWLSYLRGLDTDENGLMPLSQCRIDKSTLAEIFTQKKVNGKYLLSLYRSNMRKELGLIQGYIIELEEEICFLREYNGLWQYVFFYFMFDLLFK